MPKSSQWLFTILTLICLKGQAQKFNPHIDKDSLFNVLIKEVHPDKKQELSKSYQNGNNKYKEFLLHMLYMPRSSKAEMISNFEKNKDRIFLLRDEYSKLVPKDHTVYIEFNPEDKVFQMPASIDLHIYAKEESETPGGFNLQYQSEELSEGLVYIGWDVNTLKIIKQLLDDAGCVSIHNGPEDAIGFARSGMGKYSYLIFSKPLTPTQIQEYNGGCTFIYYKDNIVLQYGGGAIGPQCFPD